MNTKEILETLKNIFRGFTLHEQFLKELSSLMKKELRGKEREFFNCLTTQMSNIKNFGILVHNTDNNEKLKGADGHYFSIHLSRSQFNVRFIVNIQDDGSPFFLCAFFEKSGKKITDYSSYTKIMKQRFLELTEGDSNE